MKNSEITRLYYGLTGVKNLPGAKFAYAVARNISILKPIVEAIEKALKIPEQYADYKKVHEDSRLGLCKIHAKKDAKGESITEIVENGRERYVFTDVKAFDTAYEEMNKALDENYKDMFAEIEANKKEYLAFLDTECDDKPALIKVKPDYLPEGINATQIEAITEIIG